MTDKKKVLVVDDEMDMRIVITTVLETSGFQPIVTREGRTGIRKARELQPDAIILDVMMPGKVGYKVCEEIRANPETKDTYVIFLTARGTTVAEKTGKTSGGDEFLVKPFEPKELRDKIIRILK